MASAVVGLAALALVGAMSITGFSGTVEAEEYDTNENRTPVQESEPQHSRTDKTLALENTPYGFYEMMTQEERNAYVQYQQARQEAQRLRMYMLYSSNYPALAEEHTRSNAMVQRISVSDLAQIGEKQVRAMENYSEYWHNPLVLDTYVSSPFGYRWHPVYGYYRMHNGVDLDSDYGDPIRASRGGTVIEAGWDYYYGYYVVIDHGDGFMSEYFHMCTYYVDAGQQVSACDPIGEVGSTGVSTGPHLHFGVLYEGEYVDPEDYIDFES